MSEYPWEWESTPEEPKDREALPHNLEAEQAILGAILINPDAMETAAESLIGNEFYDERHHVIYKTMLDVTDAEEKVDLVTLTAKLQTKGKLGVSGGIGYLTELANSVPTAANIGHYINIVKDRHIHRSTILELQKQLGKARRAESGSEVVTDMLNAATDLSDKTVVTNDMVHVREACMSAYESVEKRYSAKSEITGVPSGFPDLDKMTAGFQNTDLIIVAARPSVGKTAFALNIAQSIGIRAKKTVAVFSLEMSTGQLMQRMLCAEGSIDASYMRTGQMAGDSWERLTMAIGSISEAPIYIDDSSSMTVASIRSKCRRLKRDKGLDVVIIDYLQLITGRSKENRNQEVSEITRQLKQLAKDLEIPVIALSQLSRGVEQRQDKRPMLSDLRESGEIEQAADIVAFLYRDDYYNAETEKKNIIEIIIAKQRNGPVGTVELVFLKNFNKFVALDRSHTTFNEPPKRNGTEGRDWA